MTRRSPASDSLRVGPTRPRFEGVLGRRASGAAWLAVALMAWGGEPALGWGRLGHRAAAKLTEARLTPAARVAVAALLEPGETLADASTWADQHRSEMPETAPWHYVNVPLTEPRYDSRFCPREGCVVSKIDDFVRILADTSRSRADRQRALRFLVHFVGDLHQPVHVGDRGDRGGNDLPLLFLNQEMNLHRIWDSALIEHAQADEATWVNDLKSFASPDLAPTWERGNAADWASESLALARLAYLRPASATGLQPKDALDETYAAYGASVARLRLAQAGVRLAWLLNTTLK
jgi:nuclease S1